MILTLYIKINTGGINHGQPFLMMTVSVWRATQNPPHSGRFTMYSHRYEVAMGASIVI